METNNQNTEKFKGDTYAKEKQQEFNRKLEDGDKALNAPETRDTTKDADINTGYKQNEAGEMSGEVSRKQYEENREHGGTENPKDVSANESGNIQGQNEITENTKERATIDLTGRSVV